MKRVDKITVILIAIGMLLLYAAWQPVAQPLELQYRVPQVSVIEAWENTLLYAVLHLVSVVPVLLLSFDKKVAYAKKWSQLLLPIGITALLFIAWDVWFTKLGIWGFNERYLQGWKLAGLPWEEWTFFVTVPFASVFIYACIRAYFPHWQLSGRQLYVTYALTTACLIFGIWHLPKLYTSVTCFLTAAVLIGHVRWGWTKHLGAFYISFLFVLIPFCLVDGVLTGAFTEEPAVLYHPKEFSGIRLVSIPVEDAIYGFLMLLLIVSMYELRNKRSSVVR